MKAPMIRKYYTLYILLCVAVSAVAQYEPQAWNYGLTASKSAGFESEVGFGVRIEYAPNCYTTYMAEYNRSFDFGTTEEDLSFDEDLNEEGIKKMGPSESHIDNLKSRSFFYDKMRILKQKYYLSDSNVMKYDFSLKESEITNYKYINYNKALEIHDVLHLKSKYKEKISNYLKRIEILNNYVTQQNATSIFINQVEHDGLSNEILFILNYVLV